MKFMGTRSFDAMAGILTAVMLCVSVTWAAEPAAPETSPPLIEPTPETSSGSEPGEVQERGGIRIVPNLKPSDALGQHPTTAAPENRYVAPTQNLTLVANALRLYYKSVTTLVTIAPGLPVTQPVEISIGYYSPVKANRITQSYVRGSGNRFLYNDLEGDGKPRRLRMDVSLLEQQPGAQPSTFSFSWQVDLDPLYDVAISPLTFSLIENCDPVGDSEIHIVRMPPDGRIHGLAIDQLPSFSTRAGRSNTVARFAWAHAEVSASTNFTKPGLWFSEHDPVSLGSSHLPPYPTENLIPGNTQTLKFNLTEISGQCRAFAQYTMTYTLHWYPDLDAPVVRDHR